VPWPERISFALRQVLDRGRGLSGFLSRLSVVGLTLAVAILLAVLAVMNGFEREMRERILGVVPHVSIHGFADLEAWNQLQADAQRTEGITGAGLFYERDLLAVQGVRVTAAKMLGVTAPVWQRWETWSKPSKLALQAGEVVLGVGMAQRLGVEIGDKLSVIVPGDTFRFETLPATVALHVVALIDSGTELDEALMLADFEYTATLLGDELTATGLALQLQQLFEAPETRWHFARTLPPSFYVTDWTLRHGNLYAAIRLSRDLVTLLLLSIIAVAAFNIVSMMVMVVTDKKSDIAILRTIGMTPKRIVKIFFYQGLSIGLIGIVVGTLLGLLLALNIESVISGIETILGFQFFPKDVFYINRFPSVIQLNDVLSVVIGAIVLAVIAAIYPARRAGKVNISEVLRHE